MIKCKLILGLSLSSVVCASAFANAGSCDNLAGKWVGVEEIQWFDAVCQYDYMAQVNAVHADLYSGLIYDVAPNPENPVLCPTKVISSLELSGSCKNGEIHVKSEYVEYVDITGLLSEDGTSVSFKFLVTHKDSEEEYFFPAQITATKQK